MASTTTANILARPPAEGAVVSTSQVARRLNISSQTARNYGRAGVLDMFDASVKGTRGKKPVWRFYRAQVEWLVVVRRYSEAADESAA